ncbi:MAG: MFS transporter, partial [Nannocystaceae bacterium]
MSGADMEAGPSHEEEKTSPRAPRTVREAWRDNPMWRRLYLARTASLIGNWLNTLAIVHLIGADANVGALAYAAVFVIKQLPTVLLGPAAGVVADRFSRRSVMVICDLLCAALALGFLGITPGEDVTWVYVLAALQISVTTFFEPARQAAIPDLVAPRDLVAANTLASATWSLTFAVGTMGGGVVLALVGWEWAMVLDAASYAISLALILTIRLPPHDARTPEDASTRDALGVESL